MANQQDDFLARLQATFRLEADEHLRDMSAGLLELEKTSDVPQQRAILETVFRDAHSLKGASRAVNLVEIETLCQTLEGLLSRLKRGEMILTPEVFDTLHKSMDVLTQLLAAGDNSAATNRAAVAEVMRSIANAPAAVPASKPASVENQSSSPEPSVQPTKVRSSPLPAAIAAAVPTMEPQAAAPRPAAPSPEKHGAPETVRISRSKLDSLLLQTEEMLAAKLALRQRAADLRDLKESLVPWKKAWARLSPEVQPMRQPANVNVEQDGSASAAGANLLDFLDWSHAHFTVLECRLNEVSKAVLQDAHSVGGMVDGLLGDMKRAVMMPCSTLLELFPKLVRDLSRDQGKDVTLDIRGGEVEVDRRILEEMKDPLIHLLRNCIDHGIEMPEARLAQSKPARGAVSISIAQLDSNKMEMTIADDGSGIDLSRIRQAAVSNGIITEDKAQSLGEAETLALIFESEISTTPIVTTVSGRGLGLAIVREKVEKLGGRVTVETNPGRGTAFHIVLPLTRATFRGILVRAAEHSLIVPIGSVERVFRVKRSDVKTVENRETIHYDGKLISLTWLSDVLELPRLGKRAVEEPMFPVLVLTSTDKRIAFAVDEVLDEQEVLTKGLGRQLVRVRNISGATVLGSGKVVPILNVSDLIKSAMKSSGTTRSAAAFVEKPDAGHRSILVAEDSITSRMLLKNILESAGYHVKTAVDGMEAFTILRTEAFDLVVSDVEMPRMNGFDLTAKIRREEKLKGLPVILVTALESREHKERGIDVGANAYIIKSSFDQSNLLETIQRLL